jgi:phenylpyruvate tautomerase PptA (4-oxalocrotonate tautomerase family)
MPLYNLACRVPLDEPTRERVARAVTRAHCEVTGAPAEFVNVLFVHGYPLHGALTIDAIGGVRKGGNRTAEVVERLRIALTDAIARAAGAAPAQVNVTLIGIPSNWVMEGGRVMPDPGAEAQWLAQRGSGG